MLQPLTYLVLKAVERSTKIPRCMGHTILIKVLLGRRLVPNLSNANELLSFRTVLDILIREVPFCNSFLQGYSYWAIKPPAVAEGDCSLPVMMFLATIALHC